MNEPRRVIAVIMAKAPRPGFIKTRLVGPGPLGHLSDHDAAAVARAMSECMRERLIGVFGSANVVVAHTPDWASEFASLPWTMSQGPGHLGQRLASVWQRLSALDPTAAVAFFGIDSPDAPRSVLHHQREALAGGGGEIVTLGRAADGGFWTLGATRPRPALLDRIDWGTPRVYDQTAARINSLQLQLSRLADWYDVDTAADVAALLERLASADEPALVQLAGAIRRALPDPAAIHARSTETRMTAEPAKTAKNPDANNDRQFAGCHLLIVDDNPQNVELLEAYLASLKCRISSASDGVDALAAVQSAPPDLILLDVMMPRMSGFEVCQRLKTDPATRDIPVLMVTALNEVGDVERGAEAGTDDFLSKPFNKIELLTRVRSLLRIRLLKRELDQQMGRGETDRRSDLDEQTSPGF